MSRTKIEWCARAGTIPESWNPVTGCSKISDGCKFCFAERMAKRLAGRFGYPPKVNEWGQKIGKPFDVTLHPDRLDQPLRWCKPRTVFVCSMGDLFHPAVPQKLIEDIWLIAAKSPQHTFIILTKRPARMAEYCDFLPYLLKRYNQDYNYNFSWPLSNIWLGVTAENQAMADERIPILLRIPAVVRFASVEPCLESVDLSSYLPQMCAVHNAVHRQGRDCLRPRDDQPICLDQIIVGGESGSGARPMNPEWARKVRDDCQTAGVPYFFKQHGAWLHESQVTNDAQREKGLSSKRCEAGDGYQFVRVGKKTAGRLLDGKEWNEFPKEAK